MTPNLFLSDETRAWLLRAAEDLAAASLLIAPATLRSAESRWRKHCAGPPAVKEVSARPPDAE